MRLMLALALTVLMSAAACAQEPPVTGAPGASLKQLAGSPTLVTVVLKAKGAKDANLRVQEVRSKEFTVLTEKGEQFTYFYEDVQEVRVQGGKVEKSPLQLPKSTALRPEDQKIVDRAWERIREIFGRSNENQERKLRAAVLLCLHKDADAQKYLNDLVASNDIQMRLEVALAMYLVGEKPADTLLREGLESGNRIVRTKAAVLSGYVGYRDSIPMLKLQIEDRSAELSAPAARSLARLGDREIIPKLIEMLSESDERRYKAAIFSLARLGGDDIIEQMKLQLKQNPESQILFRIGTLLHQMGDPMGSKILQDIMATVPTLQPEAALILAREKNWEATAFLRNRMARRENPTPENLLFRARNAASLYLGGEPTALAVFQELLRTDNAKLKQLVCELVTEINDRRLLTLIQSSIENADDGMALDACEAAVSLAMPDFQRRLVESRS